MRWIGAALLIAAVGCGATSVTHRGDAEACLPGAAEVVAAKPKAPRAEERECPLCGGATAHSCDRDHELHFHSCAACDLILTIFPDGSTFAAVRDQDRWINYRLVGRRFLPVEPDPPTAVPVHEETPLVEERLDQLVDRARPARSRGLWTPRRGHATWIDRNGEPLPIPVIDDEEGLGHPVNRPGHPIRRPGHPVQRPGHPVTRPSHPITRPSHPVERSDHPIGRPGHPIERPSHPVERPSHTVERPGHPVERPGHAITRPNNGPILFKPGHPVGWTRGYSTKIVVRVNQEPEPPRGSSARIQKRDAKIAARRAARSSGGSFARAATRGGGSFGRARR